MDPLSLTLGGLVAGLIAHAFDSAGGELGSAAAGLASGFVDRLQAHFKSVDDDEAVAVLTRVVDPPVGPAQLEKLAGVLDTYAEQDLGFGRDLEALVRESEAAGLDIGAVSQVAWGNNNLQITGVTRSSINLNQNPSAG